VPPPLLSWVGAALVLLLAVAVVTDIRYGRIFNAVTYPAVVLGLIGHTVAGGWAGCDVAGGHWFGLVGSLVGLAVGLLPLLVANLAGGIGGGDAKIMGAIGCLAGWRFAMDTLLFGLMAAVVMAVIVMLRRRILLQTLIRLARFFYLIFTPSRPADPSTPQSPKIAFGVALCIGAVAAMANYCIFPGLRWPGFLTGM
jgi:prepilin peptidase CpaA